MALPVVTVASGGLPVTDAANYLGMPVTEAANGRGMAVTRAAAGLPVTFVGANGVIVPPRPALVTTLDPATGVNVILSNGNLTVESNGVGVTGQVLGTTPKSSGKYYFEATIISAPSTDTGWAGPGVSGSPLTGSITNPDNSILVTPRQGLIAVGASNPSYCAATGFVVADVICCAINLSNRRGWFRKNNLLWNDNSRNSDFAIKDPATNVGGVDFSAAIPGAAFPIVTLWGSANAHYTMNYGATAFAFPVPYGYVGGWG